VAKKANVSSTRKPTGLKTGSDEGALFVVSNRRSGMRSDDALKRSREALDFSFSRVLSSDVSVLGDIAPKEEDSRRVVVVNGDPTDVARKLSELHPDVLVEAYLPRHPQFHEGLALRALDASVGPQVTDPGKGASIRLRLQVGDRPALRASVTLYLQSKNTPNKLTISTGIADDTGQAEAAYDSYSWVPVAAHIEPAGEAWDVLVKPVIDGDLVLLPPLIMNGTVGWWAQLTGATSYSDDSGKDINVGVVDTGVGPHPYLAHVRRIGGFSQGAVDSKPDAANDVGRHGTHVCGIIGARPKVENDFGGIAAGSNLFVARVFPSATAGAGQGDIAMAVEALSSEYNAHVINLSLGGAASVIEADAIQFALERGTLCIAAAGNDGGAVLYPAALRNVVAISALGLPGTIPPKAVAASNRPPARDKWSPTGLYLASFSNVGTQIAATAPGDGIISTAPSVKGMDHPYIPLSGTSMACPVATASLAVLLSKDDGYQAMNADAQRTWRARQIFQSKLMNIGLVQPYQGGGLARQL
jgi:subtilisin family serine protease